MASPQKENGYTPIANEIMEALCSQQITSSAFRVVLCIIRKTYGWQKKQDTISLSQIKKMTQLDRSVVNGLKELERKNIIFITRNSYKSNTIGFNKNYQKWGVVQATALVQKCAKGSAKVCTKVVQAAAHTKETLQKKIQKKENLFPQHDLSSWDIINTMYTYESLDDTGNPFKKVKKRITKQENEMLIAVGFLWQSMCSEYLGLDEKEIPMKNLYYPIRATYDRTGFQKEDFKKLFKYFFFDNDIKTESKLSFDLCLSEKYVAKYKLNKKLQAKNSSGTFEIKL